MKRFLFVTAALLAMSVSFCFGQSKEDIKASIDRCAKLYNPQNEMFAHFQTKCIIFKNETQLFKVIPHTPKISKKSTGFAGTLYI